MDKKAEIKQGYTLGGLDVCPYCMRIIDVPNVPLKDNECFRESFFVTCPYCSHELECFVKLILNFSLQFKKRRS